ncbi:hypothetical protein AVEN_9701-1 [Araneus ventricosus]|uniref:Uncharacterized protein n=1 Tax=Araneus ventricosus TaxID=182803 RepID=A0A4Y2DVS5_ARAVE|nr:hypothetical protein AVEN_9701-1 [Araneus ventricosus]
MSANARTSKASESTNGNLTPVPYGPLNADDTELLIKETVPPAYRRARELELRAAKAKREKRKKCLDYERREIWSTARCGDLQSTKNFGQDALRYLRSANVFDWKVIHYLYAYCCQIHHDKLTAPSRMTGRTSL